MTSVKTVPEILEALEGFGMSQYEAKVYLAAAAMGVPASAPDIAREANVPKAKVYQVLEGLSAPPLQAIRRVPGEEPNKSMYVAIPPKGLLDLQLETMKDAATQITDFVKTSTVNDITDAFEQIFTFQGDPTRLDFRSFHTVIVSSRLSFAAFQATLRDPRSLDHILPLEVGEDFGLLFLGNDKAMHLETRLVGKSQITVFDQHAIVMVLHSLIQQPWLNQAVEVEPERILYQGCFTSTKCLGWLEIPSDMDSGLITITHDQLRLSRYGVQDVVIPVSFITKVEQQHEKSNEISVEIFSRLKHTTSVLNIITLTRADILRNLLRFLIP